MLVLVGKAVQWCFLGPLRENEQSKLQERMLTFVLFKLMFIAAMLEHSVGSLVVWLVWFVACVMLKSFSLLARERIEYLLGLHAGGAGGPASSTAHRRPLVLMCAVFGMDALIAGGAFVFARDLSSALLLCYECVCIGIDCGHAFAKCAVAAGASEKASHRNYVVEFASDCLFLMASLLHYVHILYILGVSFTLIDVILLLNMRSVVLSLVRRYHSYRLFAAMETELRDRYPTVLAADMPEEQVCAICRDTMEEAKMLPCQHLYHAHCIRSWLEQNQHNCPMCRYDLRKGLQNSNNNNAPNNNNNANNNNNVNRPPLNVARQNNQAPAAAAAWFHGLLEPGMTPEDVQQIVEMFPQVDRNAIVADLARTGSVEETVENIVSGRVASRDVFEDARNNVVEEVAVEEEVVEIGGAPPVEAAPHDAPEVRRRLMLDAAMRRAQDL